MAGIWLTDIPALNYEADLFQERRLLSVTANTRRDGETFLASRSGSASAPRPSPTRWPRRPGHWPTCARPVRRRGRPAQLTGAAERADLSGCVADGRRC